MADDLISRQAVLAEMRRSGRAAYMIVQAAPAVDAVEVVRCKDCRWYQARKWDSGVPQYDCRKTHALLDVKPNDFCSYGEQRNANV